jgi:hypothetical protein
MADIRTSEVDTNYTPVNVGAEKDKYGNHGNHIILV